MVKRSVPIDAHLLGGRPASLDERRSTGLPHPSDSVDAGPQGGTQERPARQACDLLSSAVFGSGRWARALPAPQTLISSGSEAEFADQLSDAAFDVVADGADPRGVETRGVVEVVPGFVAFAGKMGQASPQPMVITTSAARTVSSVHGLGNSLEMSMPRSANAATAAGLTSYPGSDPPDQATASSPASPCCRRDVGLPLWRRRVAVVGRIALPSVGGTS